MTYQYEKFDQALRLLDGRLVLAGGYGHLVDRV